jgi:hypothetical protein
MRQQWKTGAATATNFSSPAPTSTGRGGGRSELAVKDGDTMDSSVNRGGGMQRKAMDGDGGRATGRQEARFNFRLTRENRHLIEQAAALEGTSLKEFVQGAALAQARRVLVEYRLLHLGLPAPVVTEIAGEPGALDSALTLGGRAESPDGATLREEAAALRSLLADAALL